MRGLLVLALAAALTTAACGDDSTPTTPTPSTPTTTDTFSGTLGRNDAEIHQFLTATAGSVQATLTSLGPDSGLTVGLSLGTWNGNACQIVLDKDNAVQSSYIIGSASGAGTLCVRIYDVGNITDPVPYEIQVVHP